MYSADHYGTFSSDGFADDFKVRDRSTAGLAVADHLYAAGALTNWTVK
jgi:hypothetical protein